MTPEKYLVLGTIRYHRWYNAHDLVSQISACCFLLSDITTSVMAGVGAAESILESELSCPVCLTPYRDPVSLGCGHCFCKQCITDALCHQRDQGRSYTCPICQAHYEDFPAFLNNFQLASIVDNYLAMQKNTEDCQIPCGDCLDHPNIAVKTCVGCEVSLCQNHVERHIKNNHILLEPTASVQERKCSQHGKLLEYNCEQDNICICVTCYIAGPHKGHNIMTLKEAHEKHLATLSATSSSLSVSVSAFCEDIEDLNAGLAKIKENTTKLSKPLEDLCEKIILLVRGQFKEIVKAIIANQDKATSEITAIIKQMEDAKANIEKALKELNLVSKQSDDLLFIQEFNRLQVFIGQQSLQINTVQVVDVEADKVMMENIDMETADYVVEIGRNLNVMHNVLSQEIEKLVWSGMQRNKVQNQNKVPPIKSKKSQKLNLRFNRSDYRHCSYYLIVSDRSQTRISKSDLHAQTNLNKPAYQQYSFTSTYSAFPSSTECKCKLPVVIPDCITINPSSSKVHCLVDVSMSEHWCVGVTDNRLQGSRYLQWKRNCLSYESNGSLVLACAKLNKLKMQLDFDAKSLGFYDAGCEPETLILQFKCNDVFSKSINVGFNILDGSLSLL